MQRRISARLAAACVLLAAAPASCIDVLDGSVHLATERLESFDLPDLTRTVYKAKRDNTSVPLIISNNCGETIWPAITSQTGTGPGTGGFELAAGDSKNLEVSSNWQGRVWGRTNCTFNSDGSGPIGGGTACGTGDCGGLLSCTGSGQPATLAEFDLEGGTNGDQTYYDISLVDGYNLPIGLTYIPGDDASLQDIPPNLTNAACIATAGMLSTTASYGTEGNSTNSTYPIPYDSSSSNSGLERWCPWDNQINPPSKPGDGVYPYPDDNIQRPVFDPCLSSCALTNSAQDCCTGSYAQPDKCSPSLYSQNAKSVCPDAYSYAYDDQTSTFIIPTGGGWEITFCPAGRSTNILATFGTQLSELASTGKVSAQMQEETQNITIIAKGDGTKVTGSERASMKSLGALVVVLAWGVLW